MAQVPGLLVKFDNLSRTSKATREVPQWLLLWLKVRKHLGLLSFYFVSVHVIISLLLFNPSYYGKFFLNGGDGGKLNWKGEASFFFGIFGFSFYAIVCVSSLPSVAAVMNKAQWCLVMGPLVWTALAFGTVHVLIMGVTGWSTQDKWPGNMPPITLMSVLVPLLVLFLEFLYVTAAIIKRLVFAKNSNNSTKSRSGSVVHPEHQEEV